MRYRHRTCSATRGLSGGIVLIGLALAFAFGGFNLPIFFVFLAFSILIGSISSHHPRGLYSGLHGFMWMLILALFFLTNSWIWFLVGAAISAILGALIGPIMALLLGLGIFGVASMANRPPQEPYYQPTPAPPSYEPYQSYQQGYQPPQPQAETYQEDGQQYQYPQYEQPQAQYPQEMPPQQQ